MVESSTTTSPGNREEVGDRSLPVSGGEEERVRSEEAETSWAGNRWPRQETLALLEIRSDMDSLFRDSTFKAPLWKEVSRKMGELGYKRSSLKCKEKFENIYKYHKRTRHSRSNSSAKAYRFFDQLEALETQNVIVDAIPCSVHKPNNDNNNNNSNNNKILSESESESSSESESETMKNKKKKRKLWRYVEKMMNEVVERQEELQRRFVEALERTERVRREREEEWKRREVERMKRESEVLVREREMASQKDKAVFELLRRLGMDFDLRNDVEIDRNDVVDSGGKGDWGKNGEIDRNDVVDSRGKCDQRKNLEIDRNNVVDTRGKCDQGKNLETDRNNVVDSRGKCAQGKIHEIDDRNDVVRDKWKNLEIGRNDSVDSRSKRENSSVVVGSSRWPKEEVDALIKLRTSLETSYQENTLKGPLWEDISVGMTSLGYSRSAKRCKEKWENINKYFKRVKCSKKPRVEDSKTCPYFEQLDKLYSKKEEKSTRDSVDSGCDLRPEELLMHMMGAQEGLRDPELAYEHEENDENERHIEGNKRERIEIEKGDEDFYNISIPES